MNCDSLLIAKQMSGRVSEYLVGSTADDPSFNLKEIKVDSGVVTSLAPSMKVLAKRSIMYLCWARNNLFIVEITSILRKKCKGPKSLRKNFFPSFV